MHVIVYRHHVHDERCHCEQFRQPAAEVYASSIGINIKANIQYARCKKCLGELHRVIVYRHHVR